MVGQRQTERKGQRHAGVIAAVILPFPLPQKLPKCRWCSHPFTPGKPNQTYCKPYHSKCACMRRKQALVEALARWLEGHGASAETAQRKACQVVEKFYAERVRNRWQPGRLQRAAAALGWRYDELQRRWITGEAGGYGVQIHTA